MKDVLVKDLWNMWCEGKHTAVVDILDNAHPGLTALFITQGTLDRMLAIADVNEVTNRLIARRQDKFNKLHPR
jgi:hypothetical protein